MQPFTISLQVHHVSRDLHFLTEALATQPAVCATAGEVVDGQPRRTSVWHALLYQGTTQQHFEQAAESLLHFVKLHDATLEEFAGDRAMLEVILTYRIAASEAQAGMVANTVTLHPFLLYELSSRQMGVKVQTVYGA